MGEETFPERKDEPKYTLDDLLQAKIAAFRAKEALNPMADTAATNMTVAERDAMSAEALQIMMETNRQAMHLERALLAQGVSKEEIDRVYAEAARAILEKGATDES